MTACVVTGGAGFIGCALSAGLAKRFGTVVALDNLHPQVHARRERPENMHPDVELRIADITEAQTWDELLALVRPDVVVHLAAETGTGQSLTESTRHATANVVGTTAMLDAFTRHKHVPSYILLSSSRAVYGEGAWRWRDDGRLFYPGQRDRAQLERGAWDFEGADHVPFEASEVEARPANIYAGTKLAQEYILNAWTRAFGSSLTILRLQNVYGPGQSLANSYTGIVSLFARMAKAGESIPLYEDGNMLRDFVFIEDVASAFLAAIDAPPVAGSCLDIGSGQVTTVRRVAELLAESYGAPVPHVSGAFRHGDVRHASCKIERSLTALPWKPVWRVERGLPVLQDWINDRLT